MMTILLERKDRIKFQILASIVLSGAIAIIGIAVNSTPFAILGLGSAGACIYLLRREQRHFANRGAV